MCVLILQFALLLHMAGHEALHRTAPAASTSPSRSALQDAATDISILPPRVRQPTRQQHA